jgi:tRNA A-37 threonylcarbamoyl transferase component Bud32
MVTLQYPFHKPSVTTAQVRRDIETGVVDAHQQRGVHRSYIIQTEQDAYFFKDYAIRSNPLDMLAEWSAFKGAHQSAMLFYRDPLAWMSTPPGARTAAEANVLSRWRSIGIDAPRVIAYDDSGLVLESISGQTLTDRLLDGTLTTTHVSNLADALLTAREAALIIEDSSVFHNDPKLDNMIGTEDGRVYLIDPGMLTKDLHVNVLDAAFSLAYLMGLEAIGKNARSNTQRSCDIEERIDAVADAYLEGIGPKARERMLEYAKPVSDDHIARMSRVPVHAFRRFARWLSSSDTGAIERIKSRIS